MYNENRTLSKFEIMDGAPVRGTPTISIDLSKSSFSVYRLYISSCFSSMISHPLSSFSRCFYILGEAIPVRLFLGGFDLTPTYKDVHNKVFGNVFNYSLHSIYLYLFLFTLSSLHPFLFFSFPFSFPLGQLVLCELHSKSCIGGRR